MWWNFGDSFKKKVPFLTNIERCPKFLDLTLQFTEAYSKHASFNIWPSFKIFCGSGNWQSLQKSKTCAFYFSRRQQSYFSSFIYFSNCFKGKFIKSTLSTAFILFLLKKVCHIIKVEIFLLLQKKAYK